MGDKLSKFKGVTYVVTYIAVEQTIGDILECVNLPFTQDDNMKIFECSIFMFLRIKRGTNVMC